MKALLPRGVDILRLLTCNMQLANIIETSVDEEQLGWEHEQKVAFSNPVDCIGIV